MPWVHVPHDTTAKWFAGTLLFQLRSDGFQELVTDTVGRTFSARSDGFLSLDRPHSEVSAYVITKRVDNFIDLAAP